MKDTIFLVLTASGVARMTKRAPSLYRNEVAVMVRVTVPDSAFKPMFLTVDLAVPEERVIEAVVEVEALDPPVAD